jgi:hypothetical protein
MAREKNRKKLFSKLFQAQGKEKIEEDAPASVQYTYPTWDVSEVSIFKYLSLSVKGEIPINLQMSLGLKKNILGKPLWISVVIFFFCILQCPA